MGFEKRGITRGNLWTGSLKEVFKSSSTVSFNVLYTLYIFLKPLIRCSYHQSKTFNKSHLVNLYKTAKWSCCPWCSGLYFVRYITEIFTEHCKDLPLFTCWLSGKFGFNLRSFLKCLACIISLNCSQMCWQILTDVTNAPFWGKCVGNWFRIGCPCELSAVKRLEIRPWWFTQQAFNNVLADTDYFVIYTLKMLCFTLFLRAGFLITLPQCVRCNHQHCNKLLTDRFS